MNNGQLDTSVIIAAGILAAIGGILIALGKRKDKRTLRIYGSAFIAGAVVYLFVLWADLREILTALAAMAAVFIAAYSIDESRHMRQDSIDREKRDRKERSVNEVAEWLRELDGRIYVEHDVYQSFARDALKATSEISSETWFRECKRDLTFATVTALFSCVKEADYYRILAAKLDERLGILIEVVANDLKQRMEIAHEHMESLNSYSKEESQLIDELIENDDRPLEGLNLSGPAIITVRLGRNARAIRESIVNAIDRAIELKTSLIEVP